jgi:7-cyano-7-deazaguanine reductase
MTDLNDSPLGHATHYPDAYAPELLFAVERAPQRAELGFAAAPPFRGIDRWNAYELFWLDAGGKPQVAVASFAVPADSPRIVESKSVKLYLTSLNAARFPAAAEVAAALERDLSQATGAPVAVDLALPDAFACLAHGELEGECVDHLPCRADATGPRPELLQAAGAVVDETLYSRLFRSVCPVTGQPDFASVQVRYCGPAIDRERLLAYLVSFRCHPGFHEHCVERIFADLWQRCRPQWLAVEARFTRRGGVDINPWRTSGTEGPPANRRAARQ